MLEACKWEKKSKLSLSWGEVEGGQGLNIIIAFSCCVWNWNYLSTNTEITISSSNFHFSKKVLKLFTFSDFFGKN